MITVYDASAAVLSSIKTLKKVVRRDLEDDEWKRKILDCIDILRESAEYVDDHLPLEEDDLQQSDDD